MLDVIKHIKVGSPFNDDGRNIVLSQTELIQSIGEHLPEKNPEFYRKVNKLSGVLWGYLETVLFAARCEAMEIHGPYGVKGIKVLIKDYFDLELDGLVTTQNLLPFKHLRIIEYYSELNLLFDVYNNKY